MTGHLSSEPLLCTHPQPAVHLTVCLRESVRTPLLPVRAIQPTMPYLAWLRSSKAHRSAMPKNVIMPNA